MEFIWQDVCIWYEIECRSTKTLLQFDIIVAKSILACNFITLREVIDSLVIV